MHYRIATMHEQCNVYILFYIFLILEHVKPMEEEEKIKGRRIRFTIGLVLDEGATIVTAIGDRHSDMLVVEGFLKWFSLFYFESPSLVFFFVFNFSSSYSSLTSWLKTTFIFQFMTFFSSLSICSLSTLVFSSLFFPFYL